VTGARVARAALSAVATTRAIPLIFMAHSAVPARLLTVAIFPNLFYIGRCARPVTRADQPREV